jgi:hypothetical protein
VDGGRAGARLGDAAHLGGEPERGGAAGMAVAHGRPAVMNRFLNSRAFEVAGEAFAGLTIAVALWLLLIGVE